ncbi:MAG: hypothetical protein JSW01_04180 [Candidatus Bathyarchaeota archaeon]|nr:MAG: hypothetical protein JSW01_04180 [Candidatus Bathyarchaeota archaeon]
MRRGYEKVPLGPAIYSTLYGVLGCTLPVLLVENYVRVLFEVTRSGYFQVGLLGENILLFTPSVFLFPFLEEALKVLGIARLVTSGKSKGRRETAALGVISGAGFSSSMNMVRATVLFTKGELAKRFVPELMQFASFATVHSGAAGILSYSLSHVFQSERPIASLLKTYLVMVFIQVLYQLILASRSVLGVYTEVYLLLFAVFFLSGLAILARRENIRDPSSDP